MTLREVHHDFWMRTRSICYGGNIRDIAGEMNLGRNTLSKWLNGSHTDVTFTTLLKIEAWVMKREAAQKSGQSIFENKAPTYEFPQTSCINT